MPGRAGECEVPVIVDEVVPPALYVSKFAPAESKFKDSKHSKESNPSSSGKAHWRHSSGAG
jgi:hypothetical protein